MKVLVATTDGQGEVDGDFCFTVEGELVMLGMAECSEPDVCGCGRSFSGVASDRGTTTARVADLAGLTRDDVASAFADSLSRGGWLQQLSDVAAAELVEAHVRDIEVIGRLYKVDTLLGRDGPVLWDRAAGPPAPGEVDNLLERLRRRRAS